MSRNAAQWLQQPKLPRSHFVDSRIYTDESIFREEQQKIFPLLEPVINGEVPVEHYQEQDMIIIGTPDECLEKILRYESVGVDQLLCYVQFGDLPHDKVMQSLEALGNKIIPQLEARGHRVNIR